MLIFGLFIPSLLILDFVALSLQQDTPGSPALVIELARHGARAPLGGTYSEGWDPAQLDQLTSVGMREHYLLGAALAREYPDILGQPYNPSNIYVRSSTLPRCIDSATSQLSGIYGGDGSVGPPLNADPNYPPDRALPPFYSNDVKQINDGLNNSQAVPGGPSSIALDTTSEEVAVTLLEPVQFCFNLANDILENIFSDKAINLWNDIAPTRQALTDLGINVNNPYSLGTFGDALVCDYYDGRPLSGNIDPNSEIYKNVTFARNWFFTRLLWGSQEQRQLLSVPLFTYILNSLDQKQASGTNLQFIFLSTAETNLLNILATLGIVTEECLMQNYQAELAGQPVPHPNCNFTAFAATILIEFYNNDGQSSVVFKYNGIPIPLCNNQPQCPYEDFKALISQSTDGNTIEEYHLKCLDRSIPGIQGLLERLGQSFERVNAGGDRQSEINNLLDSVTGIVDGVDGVGGVDPAPSSSDDDVDISQILEDAINDIRNGD